MRIGEVVIVRLNSKRTRETSRRGNTDPISENDHDRLISSIYRHEFGSGPKGWAAKVNLDLQTRVWSRGVWQNAIHRGLKVIGLSFITIFF